LLVTFGLPRKAASNTLSFSWEAGTKAIEEFRPDEQACYDVFEIRVVMET